MLKYLKKYWFWYLLAPIFMVGEIAMDLIQPDMMATIVDDGVLKQNLDVILGEGGRMVLLVLFGGGCGLLCGVFANLAGQRFGNDLRKDLFARIMNLSAQQTDAFSTGSLVTRLVNDVTQIQNMVMMSVRGAVRSSIMFLGGIFALYLQSPRFALVVLCALPLVIFLVVFFMKKATPLFAVVQERLDRLNNVMQEDVAGARVVKAYVKEKHELARFDESNEALCSINLRVQSLLAFMMPCMNIILNLCVVVVLWIGGITVQNNGSITSGQMMAAITYTAMILHGVTFMANIFQTFTRAKASIDRVKEVLKCEPAIRDGVGAQAIRPKEREDKNSVLHTRQDSMQSGNAQRDLRTGRIEFRDVSFAYPGSEGRAILEHIDLTVHPGETLGIIGATGSGKSSLVNLIPRFYDVTKGQVLVDGVDVREYQLHELRERIAIVLQKAELYSRPIEENIRWGRKDADFAAVTAAARVAQADGFIEEAKDGYQTIVTEGGHSLSGGQKQRISIARAVLKNAEILIFDDATNALDLATEARLYEALERECPKTTRIIIAQRIASIKNADRIAVLDNGTVASCGTHEELLASSEIYRDIYHSQLKLEKEVGA